MRSIPNGEKKNITFSNNNDKGWIKSEKLRKNEKNEILIKTKHGKYEFYINGDIVFNYDFFQKNSSKLQAGRFGFHLAPETKVKVDYLYISTNKDYNGINRRFNFSENDAKEIIAENNKLKQKINQNESKKIMNLC